MNIAKIFSSLHHIADTYSSKLKSISDAQFQLAPPIGGWSYSEVYFHIFDASILTLETMEDCLDAKGKDKPTALIVRFILFIGTLPPGRFKAPKQLECRLKLISREEAQILIEKFIHQLDQDYKQMPRARGNIKTKHPRFGYLNAQQWFKFTEIHLKHHLKQLHRIEKSFA